MKSDKRKTTAETLEACRAVMGMTPTSFAHELGMSKQSYFSYVKRGVRPDLGGLQEAALENRGGWIGILAVDLLLARGAVVPCVCQTEIFDNGICPKHGAQPKSMAVYSVVENSLAGV